MHALKQKQNIEKKNDKGKKCLKLTEKHSKNIPF